MEASPILYTPSKNNIAHSQLTKFMNFVNERQQDSFDDYEQLHQWSINEKEHFWQSVCEFFAIKMQQDTHTVLKNKNDIEHATWFDGVRLNFAENLLKYRHDKPAIINLKENGERNVVSFNELYDEVSRCQQALRESGIGLGSKVCGLMTNSKETVIAMLATASLGAIWSSCSPDFGLGGVLDRFTQVKPDVLFAVDGYYYNGKEISCLDKVNELIKQIPSIKQTIIIPYLDKKPNTRLLAHSTLYPAFLKEKTTLEFTPTSFNHPLYILFSSGTTGVPKCIVHGAGGTLLQHVKELGLHSNLTESDTLMYFTTCGWMMWNWMVSALALGTTLVLYDGSPVHPNTERLFDIIDNEQVSAFGTSAKYIASIEKLGIRPKETHELASLKAIFSTGSPLSPHSFDYVYKQIKSKLQLSSISGGTDIISCFALGNPNLPVYRGELQCMGLAMDVAVFNDDGQEIINEKGELVCKSTFPSQPIYFLNDELGKKYHNAYFSRFKNTWAHGDYAKITAHGGVVIYGRSDTVLNPNGVRIGTAEIYRQLDNIDYILDAVVIGQPWRGDERVVLFVTLKDGLELTRSHVKEIKQTIKENASPRHVPKLILPVTDIPKTVSGKTAELAVKQTVMGIEVKNKDALLNPESLSQFELHKESND